MKRVNTILAIILLMMAGCGGGRKSGSESDTFITVDVTASYPKKELILQDFMDVEYIALETGGEFYCQGIVRAIGNDFIIVINSVRDGDIFIFDRNGKGLRKINRKGQGGEEYTNINEIILDEDNNEMFVNDVNRILVYDLFGKFKRSIRYKEGSRYRNIYNFDKENLICNDSSFDDEEATDKPQFVIISKQDGSIIRDIHIPFEQKISSTVQRNHNGFIVTAYISNVQIIPYHDSWILTIHSSDTVFRYLPDHSMIPFMARSPSIQSMNPEILIFPDILTERYFFLRTEKMEPEIKGTTIYDTRAIIPTTYLTYDRHEKAIFEYTVYNDDFSSKRSLGMSKKTFNNEIIFQHKYEADDLFEALEKGELKGKLKEVAAKLKEEDNPVIMLVKHKK